MLQLLSPVGLWALAALSLPLAIHLWRRPPRTVRWGSLRFLENGPRRLHDLRWRERLLLAARLALLALLALLLAAPRWQRPPPRGPQHWILLDPTATPSGGSLTRLRALQAAGAETRAPQTRDRAAPDLWSLLREADAELPAGSTLTVFSPGRLAALRGVRPAMRHCRVEWVQTPDLPPTAPTASPAPSPPTLRAVILHDADRADDARHLAAALRAAAQVSKRPVDVQLEPTDPSTDQTASWVFWLGARPVPTDWAEHGANVFSETPAAPVQTASWIMGATAWIAPVRLWNRTPATDDVSGAVYWTDGFGQPLLTMTHQGQGAAWTFFGRLDPAWTDLPLGSAFPACLRAMVFNEGGPPPIDPVNDRRLADPSQYRTSEVPPTGPDVTLTRATSPSVDLHGALWTLAALLFGLERFLGNVRRRPSPAPALAAAR